MSKLKSLNNLTSAITGETVEAKTMQEALKKLVEALGGSSEVKDDTITELLDIIAEIAPSQIGGGVNLSDYFTSKVEYPTGAIKSFPAMVKLDNSVDDLSDAFYNYTNLETFPNWNTSNVTNMSDMCKGCTYLKNVPLLDTSSCTSMYEMFMACESLESVPQFNTSNVKIMSQMFEGCIKLTTVPVFNGAKIEELQDMFKSCEVLSNASLENIVSFLITCGSYSDTKTLKYIGLTYDQATTCTNSSNWAVLQDAGWTTGY